MKSISLFVVICLASVLALPKSEEKELEICTADTCKLPDCQCAETEKPDAENRPQLVMLSFNDAASDMIYDTMWSKLLLESKNPDGCPISATFFVPHQYTSYQVVNKLYNKGFEIASNSITKNALLEYWQKANVDTIVKEMGGQRDFIAKFANIPEEAIIGARIPLFQLNENTFEGLQKAGLKYDASWPTVSSKPFFPFTLDYKTPLGCNSDKCQVKGFWEIPLNSLVRKDGILCNSLLSCAVDGSADELFEWLKENFENHYNAHKAPFNLMVDYPWYVTSSEHPQALHKFLEHLKALDDVYIVSFDKVLEWAKNPTAKFNSCREFEESSCEFTSYSNCKYIDQESEKYMTICGDECPAEYPWL